VLEAVESVNFTQKQRLVKKMRAHFHGVSTSKRKSGSMKGKTIAMWGLAFKPRTDDMREAPSIEVAKGVLSDGGRIVAYDPQAEGTARRVLDKRVEYSPSAYEALKGAHALAIVTEWNEFREPDFSRMRSLMKSPVIFDGRNLFTPEQMKAEGFTYYSIGRKQ